MNDNTDPTTGVDPCLSTPLNMNLGIGFNVNCALDDPKLEIFRSPEFMAFLDGPIAAALFTAIQQFVASRQPDLLLTVQTPQEG